MNNQWGWMVVYENPNGAHWGPQSERMKKIFIQNGEVKTVG